MIDILSVIEAILFAAGESVPVARLSLILGVGEDEVLAAAEELREKYEREQRGMRILRLDDRLQMCSAPEFAPYISKALEQRKPPMLSQPALETLAVVAYFQPVTRAYVEQVRGVDSSYTVSALCERGLIEECGRLEVPGRPAIFRTTDVFAYHGYQQPGGAAAAAGYDQRRRNRKAAKRHQQIAGPRLKGTDLIERSHGRSCGGVM